MFRQDSQTVSFVLNTLDIICPFLVPPSTAILRTTKVELDTFYGEYFLCLIATSWSFCKRMPADVHAKNRAVTFQVHAERFKERAAHFPTLRDDRTGIQRATLRKSGSEAAS